MIKPFRFAGWKGENSRLDSVYIQPNELSNTSNVRIKEGAVESSEGYTTNDNLKMPVPTCLAISPALQEFDVFKYTGNDATQHPYQYLQAATYYDLAAGNMCLRKITNFSGKQGDLITILILCLANKGGGNPTGAFMRIFSDNGGTPVGGTTYSDLEITEISNQKMTYPYDVADGKGPEWVAISAALTQDVTNETVWIGFQPGQLNVGDNMRVWYDKSTTGTTTEYALWYSYSGFPSSNPPLYSIWQSSRQSGAASIYKQSLDLSTGYEVGSFEDEDNPTTYFRITNRLDFETPLHATFPMMVKGMDMPSPVTGEDIGYFIKMYPSYVRGSWLNNPSKSGSIFKMYPRINLGFYGCGNGTHGSLVFMTAPGSRSCVPLTYSYMRPEDMRAHIYKTALVLNDFSSFAAGDGTGYQHPSWVDLYNLAKKARFTAGYSSIYVGGAQNESPHFKFVWTQHGSLYFGNMNGRLTLAGYKDNTYSIVRFSEPNDFDTGASTNEEFAFAGEPITAVININDNESYISSISRVIRWVGSFGNIRPYNLINSGCPNRECMERYLLGYAILTNDGLWLVRQGVPSLLIDNTNVEGDWNNLFNDAFVLYDPENKELIVKYGSDAYRHNIIEGSFTKIDTPGDHPAILYSGNRRVLHDNYTRLNPDTWKAVSVATGFIDLGGDIEHSFHRLELEFDSSTPTPTSYTISSDKADGINQVTSGGILDSTGNGLKSFIIPLNLKGNKLKIELNWTTQTSKIRWIGGKIHYSITNQKTKRGV